MKVEEKTRAHSSYGNREQTYGIIKRQPQPSMFDILTWSSPVQNLIQNKSVHHGQQLKQSIVLTNKQKSLDKSSPNKQNKQKQTIVQSQQYTPQKTKIERPITADLYQYDEVVPVVKRKNRNQQLPNNPIQNRPNSAFPNRKKVQSQIIIKKPPFAAYGRGNTNSEFDYLKSHNVLPHSGYNKPRQNQTYQSALIGGTKYHPQAFQNISNRNQSSIIHFDLPKQIKPKTYVQTKKQKNRKKNKRNHSQQSFVFDMDEQPLKKKNKKQPPLKYMNKRGDFIQILREQDVKKNRLAFKPTECYPGQYNVKSIDLAKSHCSTAQAAGKKNPVHEDFWNVMVYSKPK